MGPYLGPTYLLIASIFEIATWIHIITEYITASHSKGKIYLLIVVIATWTYIIVEYINRYA
jgi:hypothetical protein